MHDPALAPGASTRLCALTAMLSVALLAAACGGGKGNPAPAAAGTASAPAAGASAPLAAEPASVTVPLEFAHASLKSAPFDVPRSLQVPPGFGIRVWARVGAARLMALAPSGAVLVSQPSGGKIVRVVAQAGAAPQVTDLVSGLNLPHGMAFATLGAQTYLYVGEQNQVVRLPYDVARDTVGAPQVVVSNLPYGSNSELGSQYGHPLKSVAVRGGKLYVSVASQSNADPRERDAGSVSRVRAAIYEFNLDGSGERLYARGLRNAEGLAVSPEGELWAAVNHRDNTPYPYSDGAQPYGAVVQSFVNDYPPEPLARVTDGSDHGWPLCNPNPFTPGGRRGMPFDRYVDNNRDGSKLDCARLPPMAAAFEPHSAPLGLAFWSSGPGGYRDAAVAGLHGCWNCSEPRGYKVALWTWSAGSGPGRALNLVTGFYSDAGNLDPNNKFSSWGRPVGVLPTPDGSLLISDDKSGTIYQLYRKS
ncbi:MAG: sugar dehydrogenase [Betaproteobacteria bacterium]|nr:sugar dehydrogenase [Betaproteobacteria bacterium]